MKFRCCKCRCVITGAAGAFHLNSRLDMYQENFLFKAEFSFLIFRKMPLGNFASRMWAAIALRDHLQIQCINLLFKPAKTEWSRCQNRYPDDRHAPVNSQCPNRFKLPSLLLEMISLIAQRITRSYCMTNWHGSFL